MSKLRPYQEVGAFWLSNMPSALLGDDMGLGKTPQGSGRAPRRCAAPATGLLIICPANLRVNWQRELKVWFPGPSPRASPTAASSPRRRV